MAQLVEHTFREREVAGSSPATPIFEINSPNSIDKSALSECASRYHEIALCFYELVKSVASCASI